MCCYCMLLHDTYLHSRLDPIEDQDENELNQNPVDLKKLKDDFYVDILANSPAIDTQSMISKFIYNLL